MNDRFRSELDQARDAIDALAQHVDPAPAWNAVEAAVEQRPRAGVRRSMQLAAAMVSVIAIVAGVAYVGRSHTGKSTLEVSQSSTTTTAAPEDCALPVRGSTPTDPLAPKLAGPAVDALRGGAALAPLDLDGGQLTVTPPRPGDMPTVSAADAECAALASISPNGLQLLDLASMGGGAAVGYGRVSVAPELVAKPKPYFDFQTNQDTKPTLPAAADYQDRLAWVVVVKYFEFLNGPPNGVTIPASSHSYLVFVVDAHTGSDALLYAERQSFPAAVTVPAERVSVPWTLVSRSPNGYAGEISATVLPCDGYPNPVNVDRDRAAVSVVVERPVNPTCGDPKQVTIALRAATVTSDLPDHIDHGPLGPYVTLQSSNGKPPDDNGRVLRLVHEQDNGTTIEITVGSVLAFGALHLGGHYAADPVTSSDPTVLGLISAGNGEGAEFRAWRTGHADLFVAGGGCSAAQTCGPPWILHVNIT